MKYAIPLLLLFAATAHATTADCTGAASGTPCTAACITFGQCQSGQCVVQNLPGTQTPGYAADGTSCSSGNRCTASDACVAGQCVPGGAVTCTPPDQCHTASCDPAVGCVYAVSCFPDMAQPADLLSPDLLSPDLLSPDLLSVDLAPPPPDMATQDLKTVASSPPDLSEISSSDMEPSAPPDMARSGDMQKRVDMATLPDMATSPGLDGGITVYPHVRGDSVIGGCNARGSTPANALPLVLVMLGGIIRYRFRYTAHGRR